MNDDVHVIPVNDLRKHEETIAYWCAPKVERVEGSSKYLVTHNAADGRELIERHGIN